MLYIADAEGKQVVAFSLDAGQRHASSPRPTSCRCAAGTARPWSGRVTAPGTTSATGGCRSRSSPSAVSSGRARSPRRTSAAPSPGQPFDSQLPGCVWHRLLLDALVPTGTSLAVQARAVGRPGSAHAVAVAAPAGALPAIRRRRTALVRPVGRPAGARRLAARGHRDLRAALPAGDRPLPAAAAAPCGRAAASSPAVRSLRAWYPRFSYPEHYLPAVYREDAAPLRLPRALPGQLRGLLHRHRGAHRALEPAARRPHRTRGGPGLAGLLVRAGARPAVERGPAAVPGPQRGPVLPLPGHAGRADGHPADLPSPEAGRLGVLRLRLRR